MDLAQATKVVFKEILKNNQGGIPEEYLEHLDTDKVADHLLRNNHFLTDFVGHMELMVSDYIEDHLDGEF